MALSFSAFGCIFGALVLLSAVFVLVIRPAFARRVLARWAEQQGYTVQESRVAWRDRRIARDDLIDTRVCFRVRVTDATGAVRTGVALAGYRRMNCLSPRVDVVWDPGT
jgi:hypothetical protein